MPDLDQIGRRFRERLTTLTGEHVYGQLMPMPENAGRGATTYFTPRRLLLCHPDSGVQVGQVLTNSAGRKMLTAWGGADSNPGGEFQTVFKLFDLDIQLSWSRTTTVIDPVTNLNRSSQLVQLGTIWSTLELVSQDLNSLTALSRYRVLTGQQLLLNDRVTLMDGSGRHYTVRRSETALGIFISEVA